MAPRERQDGSQTKDGPWKFPFSSSFFDGFLTQRSRMLDVASDVFHDLLNKQKTHLEACHAVDSCDRFGPLVHLTTEVIPTKTPSSTFL